MPEERFRQVHISRLDSIRYGELARIIDDRTPKAAVQQLPKLVHVHGFKGRPSDSRRLLEIFLERQQYEVYMYHYRSSYFAPGRAEERSQELANLLARLLEESESPLVLVGHSMGGVIVRRAVLLLFGARPKYLSRIDRLVLLSPTNRGFELIGPLSHLGRKFLEAAGLRPLVLDGLRGSAWISKLRIDWLETFLGVRMRPDFEKSSDGDVVTPTTPKAAHPLTIQIDGQRDRIVRPDDNDDLMLFGESFVYETVPGIGHSDFSLLGLEEGAPQATVGANEAQVAGGGEPEQKAEALRNLARKIREALGVRPGPSDGHGPQGLSPGPLPDRPDGGPSDPPLPPGTGRPPLPPAGPPPGWLGAGGPSSLNIVIMIHGIRDYGGWHPVLQAALDEYLEKAPGYWRIVAIEYGFFSALQFLLPTQQRKLVNGFMDRYLNEITRALHVMRRLGQHLPVRIHIAAHSNGTNVLAQAIERNENEDVFFTRVFLAGCVLRRDFWSRLRRRRAFFVRNDCATHDWPVGVLCGFLGMFPLLGYRFLGTAGVDGFKVTSPSSRGAPKRSFLKNNTWITGDHGAALEPVRIDSIASYLVLGAPETAPVNAKARSKMWRERLTFGTVAVLILVLAFVLGVKSGPWGIALALLVLVVILGMLNF